MARINNIELKGIKHFLGHEQEKLVQGNIYYKDKKIGFYSEDSYGGEDSIELIKELSEETRKEIESIFNNYKCYTLFKSVGCEIYDFFGAEYLFRELCMLNEYEKTYKKYVKKSGFNCVAIINRLWNEDIICADSKEYLIESIENRKEGLYYLIYTSLKDFDIYC